MSSRVQKGSTVFRPVVKARPRTAASSTSRQNSIIAEPSSASQTPAPQTWLERSESIQPLNSVTSGHNPSGESAKSRASVFVAPLERTAAAPIPIITPNRSTSFQAQTPTPIATGIPTTHTVPAASRRDLVGYAECAPQALESPTQVFTLDNACESSSTTAISQPTNATVEPALKQAERDSNEGASRRSLRTRKPTEKANAGGSSPKRKKQKISTSAQESESEGSRSRSRSQGSSRTPRPRKRAPSPPPFDPSADPGEDIDPTLVTMASICDDTGQGRISSKALEILSNHASWKVKNKEKRARMKAIMEAKKYGRDEEEDDADADAAGGTCEQDTPGGNETSSSDPLTVDKNAGPSTVVDMTQRSGLVDESGSGFDYSENLATSRYNVQVRVGPNGEMIIDEESLLVDRVENDGTENYTHVTESDYTKFINSATYGRRFRGSRWSAEETELFFEALSQYGENYELIACILPGRDRKACKNKFKSEDKKNPARINYCLNNSIPVDMKTLSRMTGKDFSGPVPVIKAPPPPPPVQPTQPAVVDDASREDETRSSEPEISRTKKRSRSKSSGGTDGDVLIIGHADAFSA